jgi:DNA-directed RNA polymerase specialized sigma24 family protein
MCIESLDDARREFAALLHVVESATRYAFRKRKLRRHDYEDVLSEVTAACWSAWLGLISRGRDPLEVGACGITNQAIRYVRNGRRIANRSGGRGKMDVYNPKAQRARAFQVLNAGAFDEAVEGSEAGVWDNCCTPADEACFRLDYDAWIEALPPRRRRTAELLGAGYGTLETAREVGVTPAAISQARRALYDAWMMFQGEESPPVAN